VGPRAGLDGCGKSHSHRDSISGPSSSWRIAIPITLSRPSTYTMGTGTFPGIKRPGLGVSNLAASSAKVTGRIELYLSPLCLHGLL
jgi:hypothetical protein